MGRRSKCPEEFRRNAVELALDGGRSVRDVARELGVNYETLRNCGEGLRRKRCEGMAAVTGAERTDLARLALGRRSRAGEGGPAKSRGLLRPGDRPVTREVIYSSSPRRRPPIPSVPCASSGREPVGVL
ncbi:transposase [Saccharopolyspora sp. NPDC002376]